MRSERTAVSKTREQDSQTAVHGPCVASRHRRSAPPRTNATPSPRSCVTPSTSRHKTRHQPTIVAARSSASGGDDDAGQVTQNNNNETKRRQRQRTSENPFPTQKSTAEFDLFRRASGRRRARFLVFSGRGRRTGGDIPCMV